MFAVLSQLLGDNHLSLFPNHTKWLAHCKCLPRQQRFSTYLGEGAITFRHNSVARHLCHQLAAIRGSQHRGSNAKPATKFNGSSQERLGVRKPMKHRNTEALIRLKRVKDLGRRCPRMDAEYPTSLCLATLDHRREDALLKLEVLAVSRRTVQTHLANDGAMLDLLQEQRKFSLLLVRNLWM